MIKRMGILAALFVLFSAYLVDGNEGSEAVTFSNEFKVILICVVASIVGGVIGYAMTRDTDNWDD